MSNIIGSVYVKLYNNRGRKSSLKNATLVEFLYKDKVVLTAKVRKNFSEEKKVDLIERATRKVELDLLRYYNEYKRKLREAKRLLKIAEPKKKLTAHEIKVNEIIKKNIEKYYKDVSKEKLLKRPIKQTEEYRVFKIKTPSKIYRKEFIEDVRVIPQKGYVRKSKKVDIIFNKSIKITPENIVRISKDLIIYKEPHLEKFFKQYKKGNGKFIFRIMYRAEFDGYKRRSARSGLINSGYSMKAIKTKSLNFLKSYFDSTIIWYGRGFSDMLMQYFSFHAVFQAYVTGFSLEYVEYEK